MFNIFKRIKELESKVANLEGINVARRLQDEARKIVNSNAIKIAPGLCIFRVNGKEEKNFALQLADKVREMHFELPEGYIIKEIVVEKK